MRAIPPCSPPDAVFAWVDRDIVQLLADWEVELADIGDQTDRLLDRLDANDQETVQPMDLSSSRGRSVTGRVAGL